MKSDNDEDYFLFALSILRITSIFRLNWISDEVYYAINEKLFYITGMFFYINATINPIIYNVMSAKYRKAFRCIHQ